MGIWPWISYLSTWVQFPFPFPSPNSIFPPTQAVGGNGVMAQRVGSLPPTGEIWIAFMVSVRF